MLLVYGGGRSPKKGRNNSIHRKEMQEKSQKVRYQTPHSGALRLELITVEIDNTKGGEVRKAPRRKKKTGKG